MRKVLVVAVALIPMVALGTAQFPEVLVIDGEQYELHSNPLEPLLEDPTYASRLDRYRSNQRCSANWLGYIARWEIRESNLYLTGILIDPCSEGREVPVSALFPDSGGEQFANWVTGRLVSPRGEVVRYMHGGYATEYERYVLIDVLNGEVVSMEEVETLPEDLREYDGT